MFRPSSFAVSVLVVLLLTTTITTQFANAQCSVCGEGFQVTIPEAIFEFPNQPIIDCGTLEMAGETGLIPTDQCVFLPDLLTMCGCSTSIMTGEDDEEETPVPAPDTPVPETPVPETPVPETPVPETPVPETPVPETPVPETPVPETPVPETPVPETPVPETPVPETPVPAPETDVPVPDTPVPVPETPVPVPDTPVPAPDTEVPVPDDDDDDDSDESKDSDDDDDDREEMATTTTTTTTNPQEDLSTALLSGGFYCGYQLEDSIENCAQPCRTNDDCASTEGQSCWGSWNYCATDPSNPVEVVESPQHTAQTPPTNIPEALVARSDSRCGVTEVDARSNCGTPCLTVNDCPNPDDFCWTTHTHYCHLKPTPHPECLWERAEQYVRRCGGDEEAARSFCGTSCSDHTDCSSDKGEYCFPVQLNLCDCFEEQDEIYNALQQQGSDQELLNVLTDGQKRRRRTETIRMMTNRQYFDQAKEPLVPYFLQAYQEVEEEAERNKNGLLSSTSSSSSTTTRMVAFLMMMVVPMVW